MKGFSNLILVLVVLGFIVAIPFFGLPALGIAVALPVIYVPGEHLETLGHIPFTSIEITNTMLAAWVTMFIIFVWVIPIARNAKEVPGRAQAFVEFFVDAWYGMAKGVAGDKARQLMPIILSIFFFVAIANVMKIFPGVDTIGELHCAGLVPGEHETADEEKEAFVAFSGYQVHNESLTGIVALKNEDVLESGTRISYEQYKDCKARLYAAHSGQSAEASGDGSSIVLTSADSGNTGSIAPAAEDSEYVVKYGTDPADDRYAVTPFIRGATTDLSLTLAIAIFAMLGVQYFGIKELGIDGWGVKFLNLPAIEKPGIANINFLVGLLEIVLEIAKVISFAFRLFGAMFAGQILMFVTVFLAGAFVPLAVFGLEVFIGMIQAFVFAILFLMFTNVAMTPHHHDDDHHDDEHH